MRGSTNKSPIKLCMQRKLNWHGNLFMNGENLHDKKSHRVILRSPLPRIYYYQNKRLQGKESQYLIPNYSWTLTLIPNWTCSIVIISHFQCTSLSTWLTNRCVDPSMWLNHQLEKDVGCKVLQFINMMKIKKLFVHKTLRCTNTVASSKERWTMANSVSGHNLHEHNFALHLRNLWRPLK